MKINFGLDAAQKKTGVDAPVEWDSGAVVSGHMLLVGMSGSGKTYLLREIIRQLQATAGTCPLRVHVFDIHGDIDIEGASTVRYSEQTDYGMNPLVVNPDPHYGGVRKRIQSVISTLNKTSRQLGGKQEAVLRNLLQDLYAQFGFKSNDPTTWHVPKGSTEIDTIDGRLYLDVPIEDKDVAKKFGSRWDADKKSWWIDVNAYVGEITRWPPKTFGRRNPTMLDTLRYAQKILKISFLGSSQDAVRNLESLNRLSRQYHGKVIAAMRRSEPGYVNEEAQKEIEKAAEKATRAFAAYIDSIKTGRELDDVLKYDSIDVLKSVLDRLENLNAIGIFKSRLPPFDEAANVWRYHLKALAKDEQKLLVLFRLEELFYEAVQRGESKVIRDVIIVDEASNFFDDSDDNILNIIAQEARKFGVALVCASQAPTHFTDDFVSSVGTKIVLGIDEMFWDSSARKLRIDPKALSWIKPAHRMLVQIKQRGESKSGWRWVLLNAVG